MIINISPKRTEQNWHAYFGMSRDEIVYSVLDGRWFDIGGACIAAARELTGRRFALGFNLYASRYAKWEHEVEWRRHLVNDGTRADVDPSEGCFDLILRYKDKEEDARIRQIFFMERKYQGVGKGFLGDGIMPTAVKVGAQRVFVEPAMDGSPYWTSRGATITETGAIDDIYDGVLYHDKQGNLSHWDKKDRSALLMACVRKDIPALHQVMDRDDLYVNGMRARRALMGNRSLGECVFEFSDPRTQRCLLQRTGFDMVAALAEREQAPRPVFADGYYNRAAIKASEPAF
jgi:hypothetical protein